MDNQFLVVEKMDNKYAYCEDASKNTVMIALSNLPAKIKENDCIRIINKGYMIDEELTEKRKKEMISLTKSLFR